MHPVQVTTMSWLHWHWLESCQQTEAHHQMIQKSHPLPSTMLQHNNLLVLLHYHLLLQLWLNGHFNDYSVSPRFSSSTHSWREHLGL